MDEYNSIKHGFRKTANIYPNISNDQQFRLKKSMKLKATLLQRLEKGN